MKTWTIDDLTRAVARRGSGLTVTEALDAARAGRLYDVDTQNAGADTLIDAASEDEALADVAEHARESDSADHPEGRAAWARERGWYAERVEVTATCDVDEALAYAESLPDLAQAAWMQADHIGALHRLLIEAAATVRQPGLHTYISDVEMWIESAVALRAVLPVLVGYEPERADVYTRALAGDPNARAKAWALLYEDAHRRFGNEADPLSIYAQDGARAGWRLARAMAAYDMYERDGLTAVELDLTPAEQAAREVTACLGAP